MMDPFKTKAPTLTSFEYKTDVVEMWAYPNEEGKFVFGIKRVETGEQHEGICEDTQEVNIRLAATLCSIVGMPIHLIAAMFGFDLDHLVSLAKKADHNSKLKDMGYEVEGNVTYLPGSKTIN